MEAIFVGSAYHVALHGDMLSGTACPVSFHRADAFVGWRAFDSSIGAGCAQ